MDEVVMNVFWVTSNAHYYPRAGLGNLRQAFPTEAEATEYAATLSQDEDNIHVYDVTPMLLGEGTPREVLEFRSW